MATDQQSPHRSGAETKYHLSHVLFFFLAAVIMNASDLLSVLYLAK